MTRHERDRWEFLPHVPRWEREGTRGAGGARKRELLLRTRGSPAPRPRSVPPARAAQPALLSAAPCTRRSLPTNPAGTPGAAPAAPGTASPQPTPHLPPHLPAPFAPAPPASCPASPDLSSPGERGWRSPARPDAPGIPRRPPLSYLPGGSRGSSAAARRAARPRPHRGTAAPASFALAAAAAGPFPSAPASPDRKSVV